MTRDSARCVSKTGSVSPQIRPYKSAAHGRYSGGEQLMTISKPMLVLAFFITSTLVAQEAKVTQLMSKDLTELPGKEALILTVEYPPGGKDPIHRHNARAFVYVLEG